MVNPNSQPFQFGEKLGILIGKGIRYIVIAGAIVILGRFVADGSSSSQPSQLSQPNSPSPAP